MNNTEHSQYLHPAVILSMLLSLLYWSYLGLTSQVIIFHDSIGYQNLGTLLSNHPWKEYFVTGPNREPLYPILVSWSMRIANWQGADYLSVQIFFQTAILFFSQFLTAILLKRLRISDGITIACVAYLGFSPTFVNSGMILFSEILTYPLILWLVLRAGKAWADIKTESLQRAASNAVLLAISSLAIVFTKGIFEFIVPILLLPYLILFLKADQGLRKRLGIFLIIFLLAFQIPLTAYKLLNKTYNGIYAVTDRGTYALYGETARRMLPLDAARLKTAFAYIPGSDVCGYFYKNACEPWGFVPVNILASQKSRELEQQINNLQKRNDAMIQASVKVVFKNPIQYVFLTALEGIKIFFWEGQEIFCVVYPDAISQLYNQPWLRYPLRFLVALASFLALLYGIGKIYKNRKNMFNTDRGLDEKTSLEFYLVLTIAAYTVFAAIFFITARYAQPMIPLFIATIAFFIQDFKNKKT